MTKRVINLLVSVVLLVACAVSFGRSGDLIAGAGKDTNARIDNLGQLAELLAFASDGSFSESDSSYDDLRRYTGATVRLTASGKTDYEAPYDSSKSYQTVSRKTQYEEEVTCFITEDATLLVFKGVRYTYAKTYRSNSDSYDYYYGSNSSSTYEENTSVLRYDMELLATEESYYLKIREYNSAADDGTVAIKAEYIDKWIELPQQQIASFVYLSASSAWDFYDVYAELMELLVETGEVNEGTDSVSLDEEDIDRMLRQIGEDEGFDTDSAKARIDVDLSQSTRPYVSISMSYDSDRSYATDVSEDSKERQTYTMVAYDINNTVIDWDASCVDLILSSQDSALERLFTVTESED